MSENEAKMGTIRFQIRVMKSSLLIKSIMSYPHKHCIINIKLTKVIKLKLHFQLG